MVVHSFGQIIVTLGDVTASSVFSFSEIPIWSIHIIYIVPQFQDLAGLVIRPMYCIYLMLGKCHRHLAPVNWYSPVFRGSQGERLDAGKAPLGGWIFRCFVSKGRTNQPPRNHELPTGHSVKTKLEPLAKHLQLCLSSAFLKLVRCHTLKMWN